MKSNIVLKGPASVFTLPPEPVGKILYTSLQKHDKKKVALIDEETNDEITNEELFQYTVNLAKQITFMKIKKGDTVAIAALNSWKYIVAILSCLYVGAPVMFLHHGYTTAEIKHFFAIHKPKIIFCSQKFHEQMMQLEADKHPPIVIGFDFENPSNFDDLISVNFETFTPVDLHPKKDVAMIYTSTGISGLPKLALITHENLRLALTSLWNAHIFEIDESEIAISYLPFSHAFANNVTLACLLFDATLIIFAHFKLELFMKTVLKHKVTKIFAHPVVASHLAHAPALTDASSLTEFIFGGSIMNKSQIDMLLKKFNLKNLRQIYGMTESCGLFTISPKEEPKYESVGKVIEHSEIKICHLETGEPLGPNERGELRFKGDIVMKGYLNNDKETHEAFDENGFLKSGDLCYHDEQGYIYIEDKIKDIIKCNGYQVAPIELETILLKHPAVKEAAVIGIPDPGSGEVPMAFVVLKGEVSDKELMQFVNVKVAAYKRLAGGVKIVNEIPKAPTGKVIRRKLKELIQQ